MLFFLSVIAWGCKHMPLLPDDPGVNAVPRDTTAIGKVCDPDTVYFARDIRPLLLSNCAQIGCHNVTSQEGGIILTDYQQTLNSGVIKPGKPTDSDLIKVLFETDPKKIMPPPPQDPLTPEQKALLSRWIAQGAQDLSCDEGCDLTAVTYSGSVWPIIAKNCKGCHSGPSPFGGILLTNYEQISGIAAGGRLFGAISQQMGYVAMPLGGSKLADCDIQKIEIWIQDGSPDN